MFYPEVIEEFKIEAEEMLNESEEFLLALEKKEHFEANFNGIFRAFHSLKGAAGMFEIDFLQSFMHTIESQFESLKAQNEASQSQVDYFLQAVDAARTIIDRGESPFDTSLFEKINTKTKAPQEVVIPEPVEQKQEVSQRKEKTKCPVIFITGFIDNKLLTEGLELGASGFLEKPFEEHEVISLASQAVEKYHLRNLLNRSINYILYQYNDLDNYLKEQGKDVLRKTLKSELENLLTLKKELN